MYEYLIFKCYLDKIQVKRVKLVVVTKLNGCFDVQVTVIVIN